MEAVAKTNHKNTYTVLEGKLALEACGDRIIVLEDQFKTGYECKTCNGECYIEGICACCNGSGVEGTGELQSACRVCCSHKIETKRPGQKVCPDCKGAGGIIVAPQTAVRRPTTGRIVSVGPDVVGFAIGQHVLYSNYSGHAITYKQKTTVRIMRQGEVMASMYAAENLIQSDMGVVDNEG